MKKYRITKFFGFIAAIALAMGLFMACDEAPEDPKVVNLDTPTNVQVTVVNRTMTVTWNAVENAQGYEITTTSENCGSGKKIINTKTKTATNLEGIGAYIKNDKSNGAVVIKNATTIEITLMPKSMGSNEPMATAVTAKVKALGGKVGDNQYNDSEYSSVVSKSLGGTGDGEETLSVPANVQIDVTGRVMTVTWDEVDDAEGYEIYTTSTGCGSGNRIINTKTDTKTSHTGSSASNVEIEDATTIKITLMKSTAPGATDDDPMATAVSAKVKALGDDCCILDSEYSDVVSHTISSGGMGG